MSDPRFVRWLRGDADAVRFITAIHRIVETWDDLIDKDKPVSEGEINSAFMTALIELPRNQFYMRNFATLNPILESAIDTWRVSNALERTKDDNALTTAFILRCGVFALTIQSAKIIGGDDWGQTVGFEIYQAGDDSLERYRAEHGEK